MVLIIRKDLKISCGKLLVQVAHAAIECYRSHSNKKLLEEWLRYGAKKVVLEVDTLNELLDIKRKLDFEGINNCIIADAGLTEVKPGTITVLGIGPDIEEKLDRITGHLKLFKG